MIKGRSFFQNTVYRFEKVFDPKDIIVSTESQYVNFVKEQAAEIPHENIIKEPERRDLLGAVGLISAIVEKRYKSEVMFFSWSDHIIADEDTFLNAVKTASEYTNKTGIPVSINERPTFPSVHNGWLEQGEIVGKEKGFTINRIKRFIEKPDEETAKKFMKSDNYLIHTGYGAWRSDKMLSYFKKFRPNEYRGLIKIMDALDREDFDKVLKTEYQKFEKISVEFGLFEKLPQDLRLNIPVEVGWKDAGTWQLFYDALRERGEADVIEGDVKTVQVDAFKNLIIGRKGRMVSIVGLKNIVVIDTKDSLLVCDMDSTQKVKQVFEELEKNEPEFVE